ncbi:MAG: ABC-type Mn2+/Zn2+ transport system permease subunit [Maribacter sp.]|jgi:ABC-type Mn2+/Zn2+ transport system permease subunit
MEQIQYLIDVYQTNAWAPRALIASSLVGIMCGVLGCFVVLRNMSLIGDALSHAVLPGVVFAFIGINLLGQVFLCEGLSIEECEAVLKNYQSIAFFLGSVAAALLAAILITWIQRNVRTENDAAIGIVFTTMFSIGVIGISAISKGHGVHLDLKDMLFGNILGVSNEDLWITIIVAFIVVGSVILFYRQLFATTFQPIVAETMGIRTNAIHYLLMLVLSFAVVASMRMVGVILVVAMLITPAATALLLSDRLKQVIVLAGVIGFVAAAVGVNLAIILDTTPGPAIVVTSTILYILAVIFSPKKGLIVKSLNKQKVKSAIDQEQI